MAGRRLILFAKEPAEGRVKTRLARDMGSSTAVRLYEAFLQDLAGALVSPPDWEAVVATAEDEPGPGLLARFAGRWTFEPQGEGSLGDRMARCLARAERQGAASAVVAGSDAPTLAASDVRAAFEALEAADVVFAPAPDGGYSLVGVRSGVDCERVFRGVRWSTAEALEDTKRGAESAGYQTLLLASVPDVDEVNDLLELGRRLRCAPRLAPATRELLERIGLPA